MTVNKPTWVEPGADPPDAEKDPWQFEGQCDVCQGAHKVYTKFNMGYESGATVCLDCLKSAVSELETELAALTGTPRA